MGKLVDFTYVIERNLYYDRPRIFRDRHMSQFMLSHVIKDSEDRNKRIIEFEQILRHVSFKVQVENSEYKQFSMMHHLKQSYYGMLVPKFRDVWE